MARLIDAIRMLAQRLPPAPRTTGTPDEGAPFRPGTVVSVNADGTVGVTVDGKAGESRASRATDEPLRVGDRVWTAETERGVVVIGGLR